MFALPHAALSAFTLVVATLGNDASCSTEGSVLSEGCNQRSGGRWQFEEGRLQTGERDKVSSLIQMDGKKLSKLASSEDAAQASDNEFNSEPGAGPDFMQTQDALDGSGQTEFKFWNIAASGVPVRRAVLPVLPREVVWHIDQATGKQGFLVNDTHVKIPLRKSIHGKYYLTQTQPQKNETGIVRLMMVPGRLPNLRWKLAWIDKYHALRTQNSDVDRRSSDFAIKDAAAIKKVPGREEAAKLGRHKKAMYYAQFFMAGLIPHQLSLVGWDPVAWALSARQMGHAANSSVLARMAVADEQLQRHPPLVASPNGVIGTESSCLHHYKHASIDEEDGYGVIPLLKTTHSYGAQAHLFPLNALGAYQGLAVYSYDAEIDRVKLYYGATSLFSVPDADGTHISKKHLTTYAGSFEGDWSRTPDLRQNPHKASRAAMHLFGGIQSIPTAYGWLHEPDRCPPNSLNFNNSKEVWQKFDGLQSMMRMQDPATSRQEVGRLSAMIADTLECMTLWLRSYFQLEGITLNTIAVVLHAAMELGGADIWTVASDRSWNNLSIE